MDCWIERPGLKLWVSFGFYWLLQRMHFIVMKNFMDKWEFNWEFQFNWFDLIIDRFLFDFSVSSTKFEYLVVSLWSMVCYAIYLWTLASFRKSFRWEINKNQTSIKVSIWFSTFEYQIKSNNNLQNIKQIYLLNWIEKNKK